MRVGDIRSILKNFGFKQAKEHEIVSYFTVFDSEVQVVLDEWLYSG